MKSSDKETGLVGSRLWSVDPCRGYGGFDDFTKFDLLGFDE